MKTEDKWILDYTVRQGADGSVEATLRDRAITFLGKDEHDAIGAMLRGVGQLCRDGSMDPDYPERKGVPPLQHAMQILHAELGRHVDYRREDVAAARETPERIVKVTSGREHDREIVASQDFGRRNEIISGIATAIASLARVKEL